MQPKAHPFLEGFTPKARKRLLATLEREELPAGAYLFQEGDPADALYLVLAGEVEVVRLAGAREKILGTVGAGDYLGEVAVLDGMGRSTAARTRGAASVGKVPRAVLMEILAAEPGTMTLGLFRHVLAHLRKANDLVIDEIVHQEKLSLVGEMAGSLMHDLRTPVSSIRLSADLIAAAGRSIGKIPHWCDGIRLQCDRLVGMAAELMEFSRGETRLDLQRTDATAFLAQFRQLNENYLEHAGVDIRFAAEPAPVELDVTRMHRVVQNLVSNAVEALAATPQPRVEVSAHMANGAFELTVKDNGPGIPAEIRERLFEPFVTHGKSKGIGLGMAIVRNIVTAHGGEITFETAPDRGTAFLVRIPQGPAQKD